MHFVKCKMMTILEKFSKIQEDTRKVQDKKQVNIIMGKGGQQEKSGKI